MTMTLEQFDKLSAEEKRAAIHRQNEATRELVRDASRNIGFTYQTLGGFYRATSFFTGISAGPFDSRNEAIDYVSASAVSGEPTISGNSGYFNQRRNAPSA